MERAAAAAAGWQRAGGMTARPCGPSVCLPVCLPRHPSAPGVTRGTNTAPNLYVF